MIETIAVVLLGLVSPLLLPRIGAIWGTVVALALAAGNDRAHPSGLPERHLDPAAAPHRRTRGRACRERDLPGVDRGARASMDQAGLPPVRATGRRRADRARSQQAHVRRRAPRLDCSVFGHPRIHDLLGGAHPRRGRGRPSGVPDVAGRGRVPAPRNFGQVHRRCYDGVLRRTFRQPGSRTPGLSGGRRDVRRGGPPQREMESGGAGAVRHRLRYRDGRDARGELRFVTALHVHGHRGPGEPGRPAREPEQGIRDRPAHHHQPGHLRAWCGTTSRSARLAASPSRASTRPSTSSISSI